MSPSQILRLKLILMQLNYMCRERWSSGKKIPTLIHCSGKTQTAIFDVDIEVLMKTYRGLFAHPDIHSDLILLRRFCHLTFLLYCEMLLKVPIS